MEELREDGINGFLTARAVLPNPDEIDDNYFVVCIGDRMPDFEVEHYIFTTAPMQLYIFERCRAYNKGTSYQWVCTDSKYQNLIHQNHIQTIILLETLS